MVKMDVHHFSSAAKNTAYHAQHLQQKTCTKAVFHPCDQLRPRSERSLGQLKVAQKLKVLKDLLPNPRKPPFPYARDRPTVCVPRPRNPSMPGKPCVCKSQKSRDAKRETFRTAGPSSFPVRQTYQPSKANTNPSSVRDAVQ